MKKHTIFVILGICLLMAESAKACLEIPKKVRMENSPFPFSEFLLDSNRFEYKTADGMINSIVCGHDSSYRWSIDTVSASGEKTIYGYEDIKGQTFFADDKEVGHKTLLKLNDDSKSAITTFYQKTGSAELNIKCTLVNNIKTMAVTMKNADGTVIAEVQAAKMQNTRSLALGAPSAADGVVNFASRTKQNISFPGCGAAPALNDDGARTENK